MVSVDFTLAGQLFLVSGPFVLPFVNNYIWKAILILIQKVEKQLHIKKLILQSDMSFSLIIFCIFTKPGFLPLISDN